MKQSIKHFITLNNKKYFYSFKKINKTSTFVQCDSANIAQDFLNADIPDLLNDLPNLILAEKNYHQQQSDVIRFRVTPEDKQAIMKQSLKKGYHSLSSFLRDLALGNIS